MKIIVLTAEPSNFVPIELEKAAITKGISVKIVNITKIVVQESLDGKLFLLEKDDENTKLVPLEYGPNTIVIPRLNEYHLDVKIGILHRLANAGCTLINSPDGLALCNDKLLSQVILNNAGIRTPKSWVIQDAIDFDNIINLMEEMKLFEFPIIVKTFRGTHGIGVMKLDSRSSLVSVGQTLLKEGVDFMLQEFCKHDQSVRIIMKGKEILASNLRGQPKSKDEFRTNSHLGSETQPNVPSEIELEMSRKIVDLFGTNFCAIDYILIDKPESDISSEFNKEILVLEVNGSPGLEAISKNWPSKNLAAEVIDFAVSLYNENQSTTNEPINTEPQNQNEPLNRSDCLQLIEPAQIHVIIKNPVDAKIDTGATTCSLHVDSFKIDRNIVHFTRGESTFSVPLQGTKLIKNNSGGESSERPIVFLDITIKNKRFNRVAFSLNNRGHMKYEILIGRNLIELINLPIEIAQNNVPTDPVEEE